jgi:hypothetical protein
VRHAAIFETQLIARLKRLLKNPCTLPSPTLESFAQCLKQGDLRTRAIAYGPWQ